MSDERDPGDEDRDEELVAAIAEGMADAATFRERRLSTEPRAAALRDVDSTWRRTGRR